jgi:hypothetical protein
MGADGRTGGTTDGAANDGTVTPTHRLPQHGTCGRADTPAKEGAHVIGVRRVDQSKQGQGRDQGPK